MSATLPGVESLQQVRERLARERRAETERVRAAAKWWIERDADGVPVRMWWTGR